MSAITWPVSSKSTWATKRLSPAADGIGESHATTVMPASAASCVAGSSWSPALLETISASTPWVTALVTNSIWPVVSVHAAGPTNSASATPSSAAASRAPSFAWSKTAFPVHFGNRMLEKSPPPAGAVPPDVAGASVPAGADVSSGASVSAVCRRRRRRRRRSRRERTPRRAPLRSWSVSWFLPGCG